MTLRSRAISRAATAFAIAASAIPTFAVVATTGSSTAVDTDYAFVGRFNNGSGGILGGGVVVGEHQILTARHVIFPGNVATSSFVLDGVTYHPTGVTLAPNYDYGGGVTGQLDLSLVTVSESFGGHYAIGSSTSVGSTITMVGFGETGGVNGTGNGYTHGNAGTRHKGDNTLDLVDFPAGGKIGPVLVSYLDQAGEATLGDKDSGGGWFQNGRLVGISDFIFNDTQPDDVDPAKYANFGFASANVSGFDSSTDAPNYTGDPYTIDPGVSYFGSGAIDLTDPQVQHWLHAQAVPEPASMVALTLGAATLLRRKRK